MTPLRVAEDYLRKHGEYVAALKVLLEELDFARRQGERADCDFLCDVMIEMQLISGNFSEARQWRCSFPE